ncbi:hypothetical protein CCR91_19330 [Thiorhodovibrio winogradskyi]|nr:hypothetical protein [Thiorhodovibrio winogradskyi]
MGWFRLLVESLSRAVKEAKESLHLRHVAICVVDNSADESGRLILDKLREESPDIFEEKSWLRWEVFSGHGNLGYGCGNNLALKSYKDADFWLVLNPDVEIDVDALAVGIRYLEDHRCVAMLAPGVLTENGSVSHLCKAYPSVLDLAARAFFPASFFSAASVPERLQRIFRDRIASYTLAVMAAEDRPRDVPIVSGSFMLCRAAALRKVGGFDPGYFLYFEDFDLSLRISAEGALRWLPAMRIRHAGGHAARKGLWHTWQFVRSGIRFFNQHGWRWG